MSERRGKPAWDAPSGVTPSDHDTYPSPMGQNAKESTQETLKALTIHQPWASLIALGHKRIETRSWPTSHRGPIAIHAGRRSLAEGYDIVEHKLRYQRDAQSECALLDLYRESFPLGAIIAIANLDDVLRIEQQGIQRFQDAEVTRTLTYGEGEPENGYRTFKAINAGEGSCERALGNYEPGRYAWLLSDVRPVDPIGVRGAQGLWDVPDELVYALMREPGEPDA